MTGETGSGSITTRILAAACVLLGVVVLALLAWVALLTADEPGTTVGEQFTGEVSAYSGDSICVARDDPTEDDEGDCGFPIVLPDEDPDDSGQLRVGSRVSVTEVWLATEGGHTLAYYVAPG